MMCKTRIVLWYTVMGSTPVRMVVTRDPKGTIKDRAYFITEIRIGSEIKLHFQLPEAMV